MRSSNPGMLQDLRLSFRTLARTPLFTIMAAGLLALGVGAAIAAFSIVDGVLLKALPYPDADRIVTVWEATERSRTIGVSAPNFRDWQQSATSFSALAAWSGGRATVIGGREPVVTGVYGVTREFFAVLGVEPAIGRTFAGEEARENGTPAVVVSHTLWTRILGSERELGALSLVVEGRSASVVGVMPEGFACRRPPSSGASGVRCCTAPRSSSRCCSADRSDGGTSRMRPVAARCLHPRGRAAGGLQRRLSEKRAVGNGKPAAAIRNDALFRRPRRKWIPTLEERVGPASITIVRTPSGLALVMISSKIRG